MIIILPNNIKTKNYEKLCCEFDVIYGYCTIYYYNNTLVPRNPPRTRSFL